MEEMQPTEFIGLNEFQAVRSHGNIQRGNVIKADKVVKAGIQQISIADGAPGQPTVFIHRNEKEDVKSVEFVCNCGRTATVNFEYEEE
jgi:hypothetical protein